MSETVILSKTSPRQRPQPRESSTPTTTTASSVVSNSTIRGVGGSGGGGIGGVGESGGRLEKLGSKSKSNASLAMVKELVHRDNSRLVKDLMALLAIREATKEVTTAGSQSVNDDGDGRGKMERAKMGEALLKNRVPGDATTILPDGDVVEDETANEGGTKGVKTAAAVASLLHHTATKEFSSLAGEIIAIADDTDEEEEDENEAGMPTTTTTACSSNEVLNASVEDEIGTGNDGAMMLHADAAATTTASSTNEKPTVRKEEEKEVKVFPERSKQDTEKDEVFVGERWWCGGLEECSRRAKTDVSACGNLPQRPTVGCFLSGPVPVSHPVGTDAYRLHTSTGTPMPPNIHQEAIPQRSSPVVTLTLEQKLDKLLDSVVKIKADMHRRIDRLGKRVEQIHLDVQLNIDSTDRALLRNDLLLIGIPHREREDLQQCFRAVCRVLEYSEQDIPQVDIRRQRVTNSGTTRRPAMSTTAQKADGTVEQRGLGGRSVEPSPPAPIVVEFMFKTLRDQFYRAYQAKRVLRLSDIGFGSDRRFFVNEVLTKYNQKLMAEAVRRKRLGLLHSVYTVDGIVYVQRVAGEKGTKVTSFSSMN